MQRGLEELQPAACSEVNSDPPVVGAAARTLRERPVSTSSFIPPIGREAAAFSTAAAATRSPSQPFQAARETAFWPGVQSFSAKIPTVGHIWQIEWERKKKQKPCRQEDLKIIGFPLRKASTSLLGARMKSSSVVAFV